MKIESRNNIKGDIVTLVSVNKEKYIRIQTDRYNGLDLEPVVRWKKQKTNHLVNAKKHKLLESKFKQVDTITKTILNYTQKSFGSSNLPESGGTSFSFFQKKPYEKTIEEQRVDLEILERCKSGRYLEAIKYYKEISGLGLKESKDYVDALKEKALSTITRSSEMRMSG